MKGKNSLPGKAIKQLIGALIKEVISFNGKNTESVKLSNEHGETSVFKSFLNVRGWEVLEKRLFCLKTFLNTK